MIFILPNTFILNWILYAISISQYFMALDLIKLIKSQFAFVYLFHISVISIFMERIIYSTSDDKAKGHILIEHIKNS